MGYVATGEKTGWPLYTQRYDGAFVAGLYGADPAIEGGTHDRLPRSRPGRRSTLTAGSETYSPTTPPGQISNFSQSLYLGCGAAADVADLDPRPAGAHRPRLRGHRRPADRRVGAVHMTMTPHWSGGDGHGRARWRGRAAAGPDRWRRGPRATPMDVNFATQTLGHGRRGRVDAEHRSGVTAKSARPAAHAAKTSPRSDAVSFDARKRARRTSFTKYVGVDTALTSPAPEASAIAASQRRRAQGLGAAARRTRRGMVGPVEERHHGRRPARSAGLDPRRTSTRSGRASAPATDDSISPVGLSSDNYAGLIFWDAETWMYPSLLAHASRRRRSRSSSTAARRSRARGTTPSSTATRARSSRGTVPARATSTRSATAGTRRTASRRSTCRETSHLPSGSTTSPPATRTG